MSSQELRSILLIAVVSALVGLALRIRPRIEGRIDFEIRNVAPVESK